MKKRRFLKKFGKGVAGIFSITMLPSFLYKNNKLDKMIKIKRHPEAVARKNIGTHHE